jgi:hypothetical protein
MRMPVIVILATAVIVAGSIELLHSKSASVHTTAAQSAAHHNTAPSSQDTCPPGSGSWCQQIGGLPE